jgi:hypothetical protein
MGREVEKRVQVERNRKRERGGETGREKERWRNRQRGGETGREVEKQVERWRNR